MPSEAYRYELYGLRVCSTIPLDAPPAADERPDDLVVSLGERRAMPVGPPAGPALARLDLGDGRGYTLVAAEAGGYILHIHRIAAIWIAPDLRSARLHLDPATDLGLAGLLVIGNLMASVLTLAGETALHASAVAINGAALVFLGNSGMGKSSLAALCCAHGADLITDDLLRLQPDGQGWRCHLGTGQLRLRRGAAVLAAGFAADLRSATPDERIAVALGGPADLPPLRALVIPLIARAHTTLRVERVPTSRALIYLMANARIQQLSERASGQARLDALGRIAATVPLFTAAIPWGLPYDQGMAPALVAAVGL